MQKRKALDSGCESEQKKQMTEKEEHTENVVDAMQADSNSAMKTDMKGETCITAPNMNMEDAKDSNNHTYVHPTDISITINKEDILESAGAHPEIKYDVATLIDSLATEVNTTSLDQIKCAHHNEKTFSTDISPYKDVPNSSSQDVRDHDSADGSALSNNEGRYVISTNKNEKPFNDTLEPLIREVEHHVLRTADAVQTEVAKKKEPDKDLTLVHKDSSAAVSQAREDHIAVNSENGSAPEKVQKSADGGVEHSIHEQDGSNDASATLTDDFTDESYKVPEAPGISAEGNLKALSSPIRGVIHDISSLAEPNEKNISSSYKKEEVNFSFHTEKKLHLDESSDNHSEKACCGIESNNINTLPEICKNDDLNSMSSCDVNVISNGPRNEAKSLSMSQSIENVCILDPINFQNKKIEAVVLQPERNLVSRTRKKLLVLDLNGLLADFVLDNRNVHKAPKKVGGKAVFKRPFCDDFLKFCFKTFDIGVWSSRRKYNVDSALDYIMGDNRHKLLFYWDQSHCTYTGFKTRENMHKPLVLKELKKLWLKEESDLPWEKGDFSPSNTLLVDDSPYKALCNPPNTGIFPHPYHFDDENDTSLGPGGDLRVYLERLSVADDVQLYVQENPFGQQAITKNDSSWDFYFQIIEKVKQPSAPKQ